jgi:3-methyl-2-oxobutanoate hydroxymethyltransferase
MQPLKVTFPSLLDKKNSGRKITMLTAYDYAIARLVDQAGIDMILIGDSVGMVALGYSSTIPVTMNEMLHHCKAVRRAVSHALVVGDMPFMSFNGSREQTILNAGRFLQEAGCDAVKVEGGQGSNDSEEAVRAIAGAGIPVLGHLGLTPQTAARVGGFKLQAKDAEAADQLIASALRLEKAGCFGLVLECVPAPVAAEVTRRLKIPTIGIGAGSGCDGQVLVINDLLGLKGDFYPRFARPFAQLDRVVIKAVEQFRSEVEKGTFPSEKESYGMDPKQLALWKKRFSKKTK